MTTNRADASFGRGDHEPTVEEILQEAHRDFSHTVEDMAAVNPGFESDEEIDEFIAAVREWRDASLA
jgi:hypothetical protein